MIGENATVIDIQFLHDFYQTYTSPISNIWIAKATIRSFNNLWPKDASYFLRVSTVYHIKGEILQLLKMSFPQLCSFMQNPSCGTIKDQLFCVFRSQAPGLVVERR